MLGGSTTTALIAASSWLALMFVGLLRAAGARIPHTAALASALIAAPVALAAALHALGGIWRGPVIVAFGLADSEPCDPAEAAWVREHAQLRGMMGGAGFLYPRRLLFPAAAWLAAAAIGVTAIEPRLDAAVGPWALAISLAGAFAALVLPARAYYYRDTTGGGAIVSPPSAAFRLKRRAELAAPGRGRPEAVTAP